MHADIEGAVRIARLAADFEWTWTVENIERFCRIAGWQQPVSDEFGFGAEILTDLRVSRPAAYAAYDSDFYQLTGLPEGEVPYIVVALSDAIPGDSPEIYEPLVDSFSEITDRLVPAFGQPFRLHGDRPRIVWDLPGLVTLVLELAFDRQKIGLKIANTWYHNDALRSEGAKDDYDYDYDDEDDDDEPELFPMADTWPSSMEPSECSAELAFGLARLPRDGVIQLSVDGEFVGLFAMGLFEVWCVISAGGGQRQGAQSPEELRLGLIDRGWSVPNPEAMSLWQRTIRWPAAYAEFRAFAEDFLSELVTLHPTAHPSDVGWYASIDPGTVGSVAWGTLRHSTGI
ncbi:hypothetical protein KHQ06_21705 [Nocardia tengchongensis]|uniref:SUKH-4 immunity protein of toxin-antitoxin system n=1 Tax=Nocardia tengchongensis TaxID=2055889 RepID=A0ABX8CHT3_9NOCA|nr:DUF6301 family protein [Nocardia tengchongensis]QVI19079.1 hypothetical protein KHQ06_21705 [Nocardia tengchongensis]